MGSIFDLQSADYLKNILSLGGIDLCYLPDNKSVDSYMYQVVEVVKVKQDNGEWLDGVCYKGKGKVFVRTLGMFPEDKWKFKVTLGG
jgi:hypothetical protein